MTIPSKQGLLAIAAIAAGAGLAGCGETTPTNNFKGEQHEVAARVTSFQKHVTEGSQKKLCSEDLDSSLRTRLAASGKSCEEVLKEQLKNVEDVTLTIQDVTVNGKHATATVNAVHSGKTEPSTLTLVKEGNEWRISGVA